MPVVETAGTLRPMREVLRIVEGVEGEVTLQARFEPRPDYARRRPSVRSRGALGWACAWGDELLLFRAEARLDLELKADAVAGQVSVSAGERICFSLAYAKGDIGVIPPLGRMPASAWTRRWGGGRPGRPAAPIGVRTARRSSAARSR